MSDGVTCPECKSQDVQKKEQDLKVITEEGTGCGGKGCLSLFRKKKEDTKTYTRTHYVCRSCGHKFYMD